MNDVNYKELFLQERIVRIRTELQVIQNQFVTLQQQLQDAEMDLSAMQDEEENEEEMQEIETQEKPKPAKE